MSNPSSPNFNRPGPGRLALDRFDFQKHLDGEDFKHKAGDVALSPTLTIDGELKTNVQEAITKLNGIVSPIIPEASTSIKGIVQLAGDLAGSASDVRVTHLQGYPVSTGTPVSGYVLTWNSSGYWEPELATSDFIANGDLSGTNLDQKVVNLSGTLSGGQYYVYVNANNIVWRDFATPSISQENKTSGNANHLTISAQSATAASANGGNFNIKSGASGTGGIKGSINLMNNTTNLLQVGYTSSDKQVATFFRNDGAINTALPTNTGDKVIFINDAATVPSASPVGGAILYSENGVLNVRQSDGSQFPIEEGPTGLDAIYLDKRLGETEYLYSIVLIGNGGGFAFTGTSQFNIDGTVQCNLDLGNSSAFMNLSGGGSIRGLTSNSIRGNAVGSIKSNIDGAIELNSGTTDWIKFASARTMSDVFFFPHSGLYTTYGTTGWFAAGASTHGGAGASAYATAAGVRFYLEIPVPRECQGATISELVITYQVDTIHSPANPGNVFVFRQAFGSVYTDVLHGSEVNFVYSSTGIKTLTVTLNTNNVIDKSTYRYYLSLVEESGAGSSFGDTLLFGFKANYTNITKHRF